jgi:glucose-1-phosphate thymidylyltransferase
VKGVILAGGTGSRLAPLTNIFNKHILPVGRKPMIQYAIENFVESGIEDILIITGFPHVGQIASIAGSGKLFNCEISYRVQDEPNGIAGALQLCQSYVGNSDFAVLLGDNIFKNSLKNYVQKFISREAGIECQLLFSKVDDPQRIGVGVFENNSLRGIVEKPNVPPSDLACTGFYLYSQSVFDLLSDIKKSKRNEFEITDVNNMFISKGAASFTIENEWWIDAGTFESYEKAFELILSNGIKQ